MAKKTLVEATINGETVEFLCEPRQSLLETLRDVVELTGAKEGCLTGDCGACSVLVDGRDLFWWGIRTPAAAQRLRDALPGLGATGRS